MSERSKANKAAILGILRSRTGPVSSVEIARELAAMGYEVSERTVRLYLSRMDGDGLTVKMGKKGRRITPLGLAEADTSRIIERVGFLSAKIDRMTYQMSLDLTTRTGSVVVNLTLVDPAELAARTELVCKVFERGYAMGRLLGLLAPGEAIGPVTVPEGMVGVATVCSITLNGVLLKHGIPTYSRFGGLLELREGRPTRFVEIITYEGTSIDPLEVFIRSGMTDYLGAIGGGDGRIGASFREFPAESRGLVEELAGKFNRVGLGAFLEVGRPSRSVLGIPVSEGRVGAVVIGGLNPMAVFEETGLRVDSRTMAGLLDYQRLFSYEELPERTATFRSQLK